nr:type I DNA topoisomerase [Bacteroidota bacterium]
MIKNLVIVESPAKAKTIEKFLGADYVVRSCFGHIRDLASGDISVDVTQNFKPKYVIPSDKKKVVSELKKLAEDAEQIWLATDEDREGEAISWHLKETLDLDDDKIKRIVFHEITKPAILNAISQPRKINKNLVDAQQARRILDRLVGFELSPILWRKIQPALSAGRVQSVAVRLIVEREREINKFNYKSAYRITASLHLLGKDGKPGGTIKAELPHRFEKEKEAQKFLETCIGAAFTIADIEVKPAQKSPAAPFTTSTLQQEASRKLGYSVTRTMVLAQKLYEAGHITYMRTDSVNLSDLALNDIEKEIRTRYGKDYVHVRKYTTKSQSAQEAHEAIRPTYAENQTAGADDSEKRLYDLIWKRSMASQMANARLEKTNVKIDISTAPDQLVAAGEVLIFDGFLKLYLESRDEEDDEETGSILPPMTVGQGLALAEMLATERYNRPPARY